MAAALRPEALVLEPLPIRPRKTDITVEKVVLAWMPYQVAARGESKLCIETKPGHRSRSTQSLLLTSSRLRDG